MWMVGKYIIQMFKLEIIKHNDILISKLIEIINIKSKAWNYSYHEQMQWIEENLCPEDIHILLLKDNEYVGYLNLIDIELSIDNKSYKGYGVGNVCSTEKGKGYGSELMNLLNQKIVLDERVGLLFCKDNLVEFYFKNDWKPIEKKHLSLSFDNILINTMCFNFENRFKLLKYNNRSF